MIAERELPLLDDTARRLYEIYQAGQYAPLLHEVDELAKAAPLTPGAYGLASLACTRLHRYDEAVVAVETALGKQPDWAWLYAALAAARSGQGRAAEAVAALRRATTLLPVEPDYTAHLARYLRQAGQLEAATAAARNGLTLHPDHALLRNELGIALLELGDRDGALAQFRAAQQAAPTDAAAWLNEGVLHRQAGARPEARQAFRAALTRHPGLNEAEDQLVATAAGERGPLRWAIDHLLFLGRITPIGWLMIGFLYYLTYRLFQFLWRLMPGTEGGFVVALWVLLIYLAGGMLLGRLLRLSLRSLWPR